MFSARRWQGISDVCERHVGVFGIDLELLGVRLVQLGHILRTR